MAEVSVDVKDLDKQWYIDLAIKRIEDKFGWWVYGFACILSANKLGEFDEILLLKLTGQSLLPALFYADIHVIYNL